MSDTTVETFKHKGLTIRIEHDPFMEDPSDDDLQWKLYSFNTRNTNFKEPSELGLGEDGKITNPGLRQKLKVGLAFFLSYYEHGNCMWMIADGPIPAGVEFQWDGTRVAGLLIWEHRPDEIGGKTREDRMKDAAGFVDTYTKWCNGEGYGYAVLKPCGSCGKDNEVLDSCYGFYSIEEAKGEAIPAADAHAKDLKKKEKATC